MIKSCFSKRQIEINTLINLLSSQRSSCGHHRCVTPLYRIPMWIFHCVINYATLLPHSTILILNHVIIAQFVISSLLHFQIVTFSK